MCDAVSATRLVEAVVAAVDVPVTVKMRLGWDDDNLTAPALARQFEQVGAAGVIIHGRTRAQGFHGDVNRAGIRAVVEAVGRMPVVGNGDVRTLADAAAMFRETGCAAISIGRGALANPFLFRQLAHWAAHGAPGPEPTFAERVDVMDRHFRRLVERRGEKMACLQFRKLIKWYNYAIRPPKDLYHRLINLPSLARSRRPSPPSAPPGRPPRCPGTSSRGCRSPRDRSTSGDEEGRRINGCVETGTVGVMPMSTLKDFLAEQAESSRTPSRRRPEARRMGFLRHRLNEHIRGWLSPPIRNRSSSQRGTPRDP
jgi:hypothetical protein